eukprot:3957034-Pleurochrysis_carterae.AAC.1
MPAGSSTPPRADGAAYISMYLRVHTYVWYVAMPFLRDGNPRVEATRLCHLADCSACRSSQAQAQAQAQDAQDVQDAHAH